MPETGTRSLCWHVHPWWASRPLGRVRGSRGAPYVGKSIEFTWIILTTGPTQAQLSQRSKYLHSLLERILLPFPFISFVSFLTNTVEMLKATEDQKILSREYQL